MIMPSSNSMLTQTPRISMWMRFEVTPGQKVLAYAVGRGGERTTAQVVSRRHSEAGAKQRKKSLPPTETEKSPGSVSW